MPFCNMCGTQIAEGARICAACSSRAGAGATATSSPGLPENVAGILAY